MVNWNKLKKNSWAVIWYSIYIGATTTVSLVLLPVSLFITGVFFVHIGRVFDGVLWMTLGLSIPYFFYMSDSQLRYYKKKWKVRE
ncbi:hypothetical protein LCGC14_0535280 [marine sediment metagenome]|uniref:Uncharacterized protein n=1 Tax=marine sediment metagenome TaxID=412755 RepID=A0A0F9RUK8_9ZZZZ